jgi:hypothetical protein
LLNERNKIKEVNTGQLWWHTPIIAALGKAEAGGLAV